MDGRIRDTNALEKTVQGLFVPLYRCMERVEKRESIPTAKVKAAIAAALPGHEVTDIVWVPVPQLRLRPGEATIGEVLTLDFAAKIDQGLVSLCRPGWPVLAGLAAVVLVSSAMLAHLNGSLLPGIVFFLIMAWACVRGALQLTRDRVEDLKRDYALALYPVTQLCDRIVYGGKTLPEASNASRGHILHTYMGLRLAGLDDEAERLLLLFELGLQGAHVLALDAKGRPFVTIPARENFVSKEA